MMKKWFEVNGKYFDNEKEAIAYETELKKREEEKRARIAKEEAERKAKEQKRNDLLNQINAQVDIINKLAEDFKITTGERLLFTTENGLCKIRRYELTPYDWLDGFIKW